MLYHLTGLVGQIGSRLSNEVIHHGVRLPASDHLDDVGVDAGTQEGIGTARS